MPLSEADYEDLRAERDADPERFHDWDPNDKYRTDYRKLHPENQQKLEEKPARTDNPTDSNEIEQLPTISSSSSAAIPVQYAGIRARPGANRVRSGSTGAYSYNTSIHRSETNRINSAFDHHPTAIERITTYRTQHFGTVGSHASSRRKDKKLPKFGGGKPYPPVLPEKEEYVVEFDGHDDPLHAQNWPVKKKFVNLHPQHHNQQN